MSTVKQTGTATKAGQPKKRRRFGVGAWLANRKLTHKLPVVIVGMALLVASTVGLISFNAAERILVQRLSENFEATLEARESAVMAWFNAVDNDMSTQIQNPTVKGALTLFTLAYRQLGDSAQQQLQDAYINNNPHPLGQRQNLEESTAELQYDRNHGKFHSYFRQVQQNAGYYDVFLVNADGDVVYSVFKELDFATNLNKGEWKDTGLARVFKKAMEAEEDIVAYDDFAPYAPSHGAAAAFFAQRILDGTGKPAGALIYQAPVEVLNNVMNNSNGLGQTGETFLLGSDATHRSDSRFQGGHKILEMTGTMALFEAAQNGHVSMVHFIDELGLHEVGSARWINEHGIDWLLVVTQKQSEVYAQINALKHALLITMAVAGLVVSGLGILISRAITRPFERIGTSVTALADSKLDVEIPYTERTEEFGMLSRNLANLREKLADAEEQQARRLLHAAEQRKVVESLSTAVAHLNEGNLTRTIDEEFPEDYEKLRQSFNNAVSRLDDAIASLLRSSEEIDTTSRGIETSTNALSDRTAEQAANLEETAAAITELSASVKSTADSAGEADHVMTRARADATNSREVVRTAMEAMERISASSQKITQVTEVIETLAFQTNLLALNAGVEAARAGDAGRGFAVVASEVRALALRSSEAAKEINGLIRESADNVSSGVEVVEKVGSSFDGLQGDMDKVSVSVTQIATAAREQSIGLESINEAVNHLDEVTQKNASMATEVHGAGSSLAKEAGKLIQMSAAFTVTGGPEKIKTKSTKPQAAPAMHTGSVNHADTVKKVVNGPPVQAPPQGNIDPGWADF